MNQPADVDEVDDDPMVGPEPAPDDEPPTETWALAITPEALAERMSRWLWAMPAPEDLKVRIENRVRTPEQVGGIVLDMLSDERATNGVAAFYRQWLSLDRIESLRKDPRRFPYFNQALAVDLQYEITVFAANATLSGRHGWQRLLVSGETRLNRQLADYYGHPFLGPDPNEYRPTQVGRGLFSLGGILALTGPPDRHSPSARGAFVRGRLFCESLPPHPASATAFEPASGQTVRRWIEDATASPSCRGCHDVIDKLGFAFERYDGGGRDVGIPKGTDDGWETRFAAGQIRRGRGDAELATLLSSSREVMQCFARHWLAWARPEGLFEETEAVKHATTVAAEAMVAGKDDITAMLAALATTEAFLAP